MRKMKDSGVEWIGEIPEKWSVWKMKHLASEPMQYGANATGVEYSESLPRYVRITDITTNRTLSNEGKQSLPTEIAEEYILDDGDILFARSGATAGKSFYYESKYGDCAFAGYLIRFKADFQKVNSKFLYYYTLTQAYEEWSQQIFIQATIQNISAEKYNGLRFAIPNNIEQQNEIVEYLDKKCAEIDALIDAKEKTNSLLKEQRQSIIYEAVTKGLDPDVPTKDSGIEWIGEIPDSWKVCKIKHFAEGEDGVKIGPFGSALTNRLINDGDYNVYSQANLIGADFSKTNHTINEETFTQLNNYEVLPGDICVSMMGTIGKCKVVPDGIKPGIMDSHLIKIRLDSTVNPKFFEYVYDKDNSGVCFVQMKMESKGSIMDGLNSKIVKNLLFPLPPIEEQDFIVKYLEEKCEEIDSLIKSNNITIDNLKEYRKSIIFEAVTGKVEI